MVKGMCSAGYRTRQASRLCSPFAGCHQAGVCQIQPNSSVTSSVCVNLNAVRRVESSRRLDATTEIITAYRAMLDRIAEPTLPARSLLLTPRLVVRESCGGYF